MFDWIDPTWIKALHVIAVIAWMAGIFYLPRLFIYHTESELGSDKSETFKVMERKLFRIIMNPAMGVAWVAGLFLIFAFDAFDFSSAWSWIKLGLVLAMSAFHDWCGRLIKKLAADERPLSSRQLRIANEIPTILMILIVIMVIVRPF